MENFNVLSESFNTILTEGLTFRKSKELQECELLLDEMIAELHKPLIDTKVTSKNLQKVENILQEYFGFEILSIHIGGTNFTDAFRMFGAYKKANSSLGIGKGLALANAFTVKSDFSSTLSYLSSQPSDCLRRDRGRLEWAGDIRPASSIYVSNGLLLTKGVTGANVLSVILHEIGHSFYFGSIQSRALTIICSLLGSLCSVVMMIHQTAIKYFISAVNATYITGLAFNIVYSAIQTILGEVYSLLYQHKLTSRATQYLGWLGKMINTAGAGANYALASFRLVKLFELIGQGYFNVKSLLLNGAMPFLKMDMLGEEKFADEFAAIHGYGPDLVDSLTKMYGVAPWERGDDSVGIDQFLNFMTAILDTIRPGLDPHPDIGGRPVFLLDFYKGQLTRVTDKKEREFIEDQIVKTIKASALYNVTAKKAKPLQLEKMKNSSTTALLAGSSIFDLIKDIISSKEGSANNLDDKLTKDGV